MPFTPEIQKRIAEITVYDKARRQEGDGGPHPWVSEKSPVKLVPSAPIIEEPPAPKTTES